MIVDVSTPRLEPRGFSVLQLLLPSCGLIFIDPTVHFLDLALCTLKVVFGLPADKVVLVVPFPLGATAEISVCKPAYGMTWLYILLRYS